MSDPQVVVVIPSRYAATRLPGKPLVNLAGKPMVQRVYEQAKLAQTVHRVLHLLQLRLERESGDSR